MGFAQEVDLNKIDEFITEIETGKYKVEEIGIQETDVYYGDQVSNFYSLNEIVIRDKNLGAVKFDIKVNDALYERYVGDGILICTSFGSTAQNLSYGGSIVYNTIPSLQITPIAPINSSAYRTLDRSIIIPSGLDIDIVPFSDKRNMVVVSDAKVSTFDDVERISTKMDSKKIRYLRLSNYNFVQKVNEKMLKK